jgi:hypothetical protein
VPRISRPLPAWLDVRGWHEVDEALLTACNIVESVGGHMPGAAQRHVLAALAPRLAPHRRAAVVAELNRQAAGRWRFDDELRFVRPKR